jgi:hypothetical protein
MNVLILTPDAVGSTLLQRLITIYMQFHDFDKPVINLHELTNGLEKYYSPEFGREIVSKSRVKNWSYYQSLEEVVQILSEVDHYKTSRLAQYHIKNRNDPINQQIPFYRYLDENFFVIACRRKPEHLQFPFTGKPIQISPAHCTKRNKCKCFAPINKSFESNTRTLEYVLPCLGFGISRGALRLVKTRWLLWIIGLRANLHPLVNDGPQ